MFFEDFKFSRELSDGLDAMGFKKPTPIQAQAIPLIQQQKDLIACAQTGTGKTAAFLLPLLDRIVDTDHRHLNTLILVPTRELALQIDQQLEGFAYFTGVSSIAVYGGGSGEVWDQQKNALESGADVIIATPGRLIAHLAGGKLDFSHLKHLVLDEADRMLDMGFYDDLIKIISFLPKQRQTLLFSATMPPKIRTLAGRILNNPEQVNIAIAKPAEGIVQQAYSVYDTQKLDLLKHILKTGGYGSAIIFASRKDGVKQLERTLRKQGVAVQAFHSDLEQQEREHIMREFKSKKVTTLIGTDILSRGIDVEGIDLVLNYDVPPDAEDYIHRIGRTARAERKGTAITFINELDQRRFKSIEDLMERVVEKVALPEGFGEGPEYNPQSRKSGQFRGHRAGGKQNNKRRRFRNSKGPRSR